MGEHNRTITALEKEMMFAEAAQTQHATICAIGEKGFRRIKRHMVGEGADHHKFRVLNMKMVEQNFTDELRVPLSGTRFYVLLWATLVKGRGLADDPSAAYGIAVYFQNPKSNKPKKLRYVTHYKACCWCRSVAQCFCENAKR